MGSKGRWKLLLISTHVHWFVGILFSTIITTHLEGAVQRRWNPIDISLSERDSMAKKKILPHVKPVILANHYPAIMAVFPHTRPPKNPVNGLEASSGSPRILAK
jgi:hypothetical protein